MKFPHPPLVAVATLLFIAWLFTTRLLRQNKCFLVETNPVRSTTSGVYSYSNKNTFSQTITTPQQNSDYPFLSDTWGVPSTFSLHYSKYDNPPSVPAIITATEIDAWEPPLPSLSCNPDIHSTPPKRRNTKRNRNFEIIVNHPATMLLLLINSACFYKIKSDNIDPSRITMSYNSIVVDKETFRIVTASLSHIEWMHFGFNMMSTYNLGLSLEPLYGSVPYFYLNVALLVTSILAVLFLTKLQLRWNPSEDSIARQPALGFSCVLFALIVLTSSLRDTFCPLPMFEDFCFKTWELFDTGVKFNPSPFILLFVAQWVLPRTSFIGHLGGIVVGYLFSWIQFLPGVLDLAVMLPLLVVVDVWFRGSTLRVVNNRNTRTSVCLVLLLFVVFDKWTAAGQVLVTVLLCFDCDEAAVIVCGWVLPICDMVSLGGLVAMSDYVAIVRVGFVDVGVIVFILLSRIGGNLAIAARLNKSDTAVTTSAATAAYSGRGYMLSSSRATNIEV